MTSFTLRIYLTVVLALALFASGAGWLFQRQVQSERGRFEAQASERIAAWGDLIQRSLPAADADPGQQAEALSEWSQRLRVPMALDDASGPRIGASESYLRRSELPGAPRGLPVQLDDGRTLWVMRGADAGDAPRRHAAARRPRRPGGFPAAVAARGGAGGDPAAAVRGRGGGGLSGGAAPDATPEQPEGRRRALRRRRARPARRRDRAATRWRRWPPASTRPPNASRRWCVRTSRCSPMPATNCARRWRG